MEFRLKNGWWNMNSRNSKISDSKTKKNAYSTHYEPFYSWNNKNQWNNYRSEWLTVGVHMSVSTSVQCTCTCSSEELAYIYGKCLL